jgi:nucleoside-diphosphate-sugar epimerase
MFKVVITGATGFIGQNLSKLLADIDSEFFILTRNEKLRFSFENIHVVPCDVLDFDYVKKVMNEIKPSHLLHLAWGISPSDYNLPENFEWLKASINLLEGFHLNGGHRAIMTGSCFEYNWDNALCIENVTAPNFSNLYSANKNVLKDYATTYCQYHGVELAWIRPFFLFGPHENTKRLIPHIIISLLKGEKATIMNGEILRDYMYVQDTAKIISNLIFTEFTGLLNIATGIPIKLGEMGRMVATSLGKEDLLEVRTSEVKNHRVVVADINKLRGAIQFELTPINTGLQETIDWWKYELNSNKLKQT